MQFETEIWQAVLAVPCPWTFSNLLMRSDWWKREVSEGHWISSPPNSPGYSGNNIIWQFVDSSRVESHFGILYFYWWSLSVLPQFLYVNSAFSPNPDELVIDLYNVRFNGLSACMCPLQSYISWNVVPNNLLMLSVFTSVGKKYESIVPLWLQSLQLFLFYQFNSVDKLNNSMNNSVT